MHPHTNYYVGGNTKFYGAALLRLRKEDFGELKHHGGISPAWPVSYDEMEPYYTQAEHLYQVHGERGVEQTEPYASAPYLYPQVSHEPRIQKLHDDFARIGYKPFHVPLGIMAGASQQRLRRKIAHQRPARSQGTRHRVSRIFGAARRPALSRRCPRE